MKRIFFSLIAVIVTTLLTAQPGDTTKFQTFTFNDIVKRRATFSFPDEAKTYQKILMYKTLKCDSRTTQDGNPCGEWDYLTYIYLWDSTGNFDSTLMTQSNFLVDGQSLNRFTYSLSQPFDSLKKEFSVNKIASTITASSNWLLDSATLADYSFDPVSNSKAFYTYPASMLTKAGIVAGDISGISLLLNSKENASIFATLAIGHHSGKLSPAAIPNSLSEVYRAPITVGLQELTYFAFDKLFTWDGKSDLVISLSMHAEKSLDQATIRGSAVGDSIAMQAANQGYLDFNGIDYVEIPAAVSDKLATEISISFWCYGGDALPRENSIFEALDADGNRLLNLHLPWSDSKVYWDAGYSEGKYDRQIYQSKDEEFKGKWNHWTVTKNTKTGDMKIFLNGVRVSLGAGKKREIGKIATFKLGSAANGKSNYPGAIDQFQLWSKELNATQIQKIMYQNLDAADPLRASLVVDYSCDETLSIKLKDYSGNGFDGIKFGIPTTVTMPADELFKGFEFVNFVPWMLFDQSEYTYTTEKLNYTFGLGRESKLLQLFTKDKNPAEADESIQVWQSTGYGYYFDEKGVTDSFAILAAELITKSEFQYYRVFEVVDKWEIGRFITPYGINLDLGANGFTWVYDVTDYAHLLKGLKTIEAGNQQELIDLRFEYIEGTPAREVVRMDEIWKHGSYSYKNLDNDQSLSLKQMNIDANMSTAKVITRLTGHGHNTSAPDGSFPHCCEWKDNTHTLWVDKVKVADWHIWRDDCDHNPVYPQGGTWTGAREGWCPGDLVPDYEFEVGDFIKGNTAGIDYSITPVPTDNPGMGGGNYLVSMQLVQYGKAKFTNDAEVYEVIRPNDQGYFSRVNPPCEGPIVVLRNTGEKKLTSVKFTYWVEGGNKEVFNWTGNLGFMQKETVALPLRHSAFWIGTEDRFHVEVSEPNNTTDEYEHNNHFTTTFKAVPVYTNKLKFILRTNNVPADNRIEVRKASGEVVYELKNLAAGTSYEETLDLAPGCYVLELFDEGYGLSHWAWPEQGTGSFLMRSAENTLIKNFNADFGKNIYFPFAVESLNEIKTTEESVFQLFPNPTADKIYLNFVLRKSGATTYQVLNLQGVVVKEQSLGFKGDGLVEIDTELLSVGTYLLKLNSDQENYIGKFVVEK